MFIVGNEGAELVYQGKGGTGSAYEVTAPTFTKPTEDKVSARKETSDINSKLNLLNTGRAKAWEVDQPELQQDYDVIVQKLKTFETTKNKQDKRDQWYALNADIGNLQQKIYASNKQRDSYVREAQRINSDTKGVYNQEPYENQPSAWEELEVFKSTPIMKRGEAPKVSTNTTQTAIGYVLKNVKTKAEWKDDYTRQADGTWKSTKKKKVDPIALQEDLVTTLNYMPANLRNVLISTPTVPGSNTTLLDEYFNANPAAKSITDKNQQYQGFLDWVAEEKLLTPAFNQIQQMEGEKESKVKIQGKSSGGLKQGFRLVNGLAYSAGALYKMNKLDDQGTYRIDVNVNAKTGPKENPLQKWTITGAELKKITGSNNPSIIDNNQYAIEGTLDSVDMNEEKGLEPSINVIMKNDAGKTYAIDQNGNIVSVPAITKSVPVSYGANELSFAIYGSTIGPLYSAMKASADEAYKKKKGAPASGGASGTKANTGGKKQLPVKPK
jgi:hypothetical protein